MNHAHDPLPLTAPSSQQKDSVSRHTELLGIRFANIDMKEALTLINTSINSPEPQNLFFVNTHCLNIAYSDADYRVALQKADYVFPDGSGVKLGCSINRVALAENLNGTDLFPRLCEQLSKHNKTIYLLGAKPGVAEQVADWIRQQYPKLTVAGTQHGFFDADQQDTIIDNINNSGADVLLVAMGVPMQERWLSENKQRLNTRLNLAVGGLFDFYSRRIPRAPLWMRRMGVEWLCRLYHEPSRMWRRYLIGNPLYIFRLLRLKHQHIWFNYSPERTFGEDRKQFANFKSHLLRLWFHMGLWSDRNSKRFTDLILSGYALLMLSPIFLLVAIAIKLDSKGPVFFTQERAGYRGRPFKMWKFRSMQIDAEQRKDALQEKNEMAAGVTFKMRDDPRITAVGRFIRKYSIDELPQLFNVLCGDMSVVGPRPALYSELSQYEISQRARLDSIPGLTSEWVVAGRSNIDFTQQALLDIDYVKRRSFWTDLKLITKTIPIVLSGKGAC